MANWVYKVVDLSKLNVPDNKMSEQETEVLNSFGKDGWELISVTEEYSYEGGRFFHKAYFRKQIE